MSSVGVDRTATARFCKVRPVSSEDDVIHLSRLHESTQEFSTWSSVVQGLTSPIHTTQDLATVMLQWNEGDSASWNISALEDFLDSRATTEVAAALSLSGSANTTPPRMVEPDGDMRMNEDNKATSNCDYYHTQVLTDAQFLSPTERDRFFKVVLPKIQELALRLPELVRKPIPLLKQQQDSAVTLSQEQIACLLANAFFCTFPCRNVPNRALPKRKKRSYDDKSEVNRSFGSTSATTSASRAFSVDDRDGRTLEETPRDPYGAATKYVRGNHIKRDSTVDALRPKARFKNAQGQISLFAYFNKQEPTTAPDESVSPRLSLAEGNRERHQHQSASKSAPENERESMNYSKDEGGEGIRRPKTTLPRYPSINFSSLFYSEEGTCTSTNAAKLRCLLHYFDRVTTSMPDGAVTFHRQVLKTPVTLTAAERDATGDFRYVNVKVDIDNPLEDDAPLGALQLDFANKVIGGGVLDRGAVQEEIRFVICPELIISRLFTQQLQDNEALLIKGAERFSNYNGYARTFEWHSDHVDTTPRDKLGRRRTEICAIDALPFKFKDRRLEQFGEEYLMREINKALAGFRLSPITNSEWGMLRPEQEEGSRLQVASLIATGNWGCGAFGGHLQLKFLIQWMAASVCAGYTRDDAASNSTKNKKMSMGRDLIYYTYGLDELGVEIEDFVKTMQTTTQFYEPEDYH
ncbi:hypothetical protein BGZ52_007003 [Haplosporangium bisporale]|nr:hypothetical protein BGZ52_007003 [Haplosporangium bisporale]